MPKDFEKVSTLENGTPVFYTNTQGGENMEKFVENFKEAGDSWIWIVNCKGLKSKNFGHGQGAADILQNSGIEKFFLVNPTLSVKIFSTIVWPFLKTETKKKIHICSSGPIHTMDTLEKIGMNKKDLMNIVQRIQ
jgi:hypothetical protein